MEFLARELSRSVRYKRPISLIMFDIDRFKAINDDRGHLCGDYVLRELAGRLKTIIRAEELLARYGGEEFAVVLPECPPEDAVRVGERIRALIEATPFRFDDVPIVITVSVGVACVTGGEEITPAELTERADTRLFEAKRGCRNRVVVCAARIDTESSPPARELHLVRPVIRAANAARRGFARTPIRRTDHVGHQAKRRRRVH